MSEFYVPTLPLDVELRCVDGRSFAGRVFLPTQSSVHDGPMRPDEWLNGAPDFFPFSPYGAALRTVVNKREVLVLTVGADTVDTDLAGSGPTYRVVVEVEGRQLEGAIDVDMPRSQQRLVDFLNQPDAFVAVRDGGRCHLVQKQRITRVIEVPEE